MNRQRGFSLLELALVLVIVGVLLGGAIQPWRQHRQSVQWQKQQALLQQAQRHLLAFALARGRLPCPDSDGDGRENNGNGHCEATPIGFAPSAAQRRRVVSGLLPGRDLGLPVFDAVGQPLRYSVSLAFADAASSPDPADFPLGSTSACPLPRESLLPRPSFSLCSRGGLRVLDAGGLEIANDLPFVILATAGSERGPEEAENLDGDRSFVLRPPHAQFNDQLIWQPAPVLALALIQAGRLP